ncbi:MAG TPA: hypothetical protein VNN73_07870 [Blastocatellia bacterium]|nr:hypothetical protein [Blastocatellia bacterium]
MKKSMPLRLVIVFAMLGLLWSGLIIPPGTPVRANSAVTIKPESMGSWVFQMVGSGTGGFETGPAVLGTGSLELKVGGIVLPNLDRTEFRNTSYNGVKLSDLSELSYDTFISSGSGCAAPYILLSVDVDGDGHFDPDNSPDDGLFFEPCYQTGQYITEPPGQTIIPQNGGVVLHNSWQHWDALHGGWWSAKYGGQGGPPLTTISGYISNLATLFPDFVPTIVNTSECLGGVRVRVGPGDVVWNNFEGNVDNLKIGVNGADTLYDFEPGPAPVSPLVVDNVTVSPNVLAANSTTPQNVTLSATIKGSSNILGAEYSTDGGTTWHPMNATDGAFNEPNEDGVENVSVTINNVFANSRVIGFSVRGRICGVESPEGSALLAVYDPGSGFVTGGGWINSPAGAFKAKPELSGRATFGFVSKYQKGATIPTGETEFQFRVANFNFQSSSYDWLVIAGARAQYKGMGTVNGAGNYGFMLTAIDGQVSGGGGFDKFRMKIWDKNNGDAIIYDNQMGDTDNAVPTTVIGGGSIVIHK